MYGRRENKLCVPGLVYVHVKGVLLDAILTPPIPTAVNLIKLTMPLSRRPKLALVKGT